MTGGASTDDDLAAIGYEVWDYETGNCVGWYDSKAAALAALAEDAGRLGAAAVATTVMIAVADERELARLRAEVALLRSLRDHLLAQGEARDRLHGERLAALEAESAPAAAVLAAARVVLDHCLIYGVGPTWDDGEMSAEERALRDALDAYDRAAVSGRPGGAAGEG